MEPTELLQTSDEQQPQTTTPNLAQTTSSKREREDSNEPTDTVQQPQKKQKLDVGTSQTSKSTQNETSPNGSESEYSSRNRPAEDRLTTESREKWEDRDYWERDKSFRRRRDRPRYSDRDEYERSPPSYSKRSRDEIYSRGSSTMTRPRDPYPPDRDNRDRYQRSGRSSRSDYDRDRRSGSRRWNSYGRSDSYYQDHNSKRSDREDVFDLPLKSYKQFLETQDDNITPADAQAKYDEYKKEFLKRKSVQLFNDHKEKNWFIERYSPEKLEKRNQIRKDGSQQFKNFLGKENENNFKINLDCKIFYFGEKGEILSQQQNTQQQPQQGGEEKKEDGNGDTKEENDKKSGSSDAVTKNNYRYLYISNWPVDWVINEQKEKVEDDKMEIEGEEKEKDKVKEILEKLEGVKEILISEIPGIPLVNKNDSGNHYDFSNLSSSLNKKNGISIWFGFENEQISRKAIHILENIEIEEGKKLNVKSSSNRHGVHLQPQWVSHPDVIHQHFDKINELIPVFDQFIGIDTSSSTYTSLFSSSSSTSELNEKEKLDLGILYLRMVHCFCFYCGEQFVNEDDLVRKCGEFHFRNNFFVENLNVVVVDESFESKFISKIDVVKDLKVNDKVDVYTAKDFVDKSLSEFYLENIKREDVEKFRCQICSKLFCGEDFVRKHLNLKHIDLVKSLKQKAFDEQFFKNYMNDPDRIQPNIEPVETKKPPASSTSSSSTTTSTSSSHSYPSRKGYGNYESRSNSYRSSPPPYSHSRRKGRDGRSGRDNDNIDKRNSGGSGGGSVGGGSVDVAAPPPGLAPDPRARVNYVDLDAPDETPVVIDYRTAITYDEEESFAHSGQ